MLNVYTTPERSAELTDALPPTEDGDLPRMCMVPVQFESTRKSRDRL